jgi:hypothetical protein
MMHMKDLTICEVSVDDGGLLRNLGVFGSVAMRPHIREKRMVSNQIKKLK